MVPEEKSLDRLLALARTSSSRIRLDGSQRWRFPQKRTSCPRLWPVSPISLLYPTSRTDRIATLAPGQRLGSPTSSCSQRVIGASSVSIGSSVHSPPTSSRPREQEVYSGLSKQSVKPFRTESTRKSPPTTSTFLCMSTLRCWQLWCRV